MRPNARHDLGGAIAAVGPFRCSADIGCAAVGRPNPASRGKMPSGRSAISGVPALSSLFGRVRAALSLRRRDERRHVAALASHLRVSRADAEWIYRRSRAVGYPTAMTEFAKARDQAEPRERTDTDLT